MRIPLAKPDIMQREIDLVNEVLRTGVLSIGLKVEQFERDMCDYIGVKHAVAVNSGTSGLHLLVRALGIGNDDEVITTPFSFVASSNCVLFEGGKPIFVDIDPKTFNLDINQIESKITKKTKAILAVDVFGQPYDMEAILMIAKKYNLKVIDDSCEAIGSKYKNIKVGSRGDGAVFAFYPNKQMTTAEGGIIVTNDDYIADLCRSMRSQGRAITGTWLYHERVGYNYRLSELHAALGIAQLERLDDMLAEREKVAQTYNRYLSKIEGVTVPYIAPEVTRMSWFVYVIQVQNHRDEIMNYLLEQGISCKPYFTPIHLQPYFLEMGYKEGNFPITEDIGNRSIALPFFNKLSEEEIQYVSEHLAKAVSQFC